jgi:hypothetical protein
LAVSLSTTSSTSLNRKGLVSTSSAPAARNRSRSPATKIALAITIAMPGLCSLIRRIASEPPITGIARSMRMTSGE